MAARGQAGRAEGKALIELGKEKVFQVSRGFEGPPRRGGGNRTHGKTLRGWIRDGRRAPDGELVFLESLNFAGTLCTSVEAIQRFCERLTPPPAARSPPATPAQRSREDQRASEECERLGL